MSEFPALLYDITIFSHLLEVSIEKGPNSLRCAYYREQQSPPSRRRNSKQFVSPSSATFAALAINLLKSSQRHETNLAKKFFYRFRRILRISEGPNLLNISSL